MSLACALTQIRSRKVGPVGLPLAGRYVDRFAGRPRPRHRDVVRFLLDDAEFRRALATHRARISIAEWIAEPQRMQPVAAARSWAVPSIQSGGDLADWLSLTPSELTWFADLKGLGYRSGNPKLQHYRYRILLKPSGGVRLIESPKPPLKELQERILFHILNHVPAHPFSHGFVKGRSIVTFAAPHAARQVVLRVDLEDFFPAFPAARVQAVFRTLGYPDKVASLLAGICTNSVRSGARVRWECIRRAGRNSGSSMKAHTCRRELRHRRRSPTSWRTAWIAGNCARHGPRSQNRQSLPGFQAHLRGRIGFVTMVDRAKGERLSELFATIDWSR